MSEFVKVFMILYFIWTNNGIKGIVLAEVNSRSRQSAGSRRIKLLSATIPILFFTQIWIDKVVLLSLITV